LDGKAVNTQALRELDSVLHIDELQKVCNILRSWRLKFALPYTVMAELTVVSLSIG
jgi:hypothetical protein